MTATNPMIDRFRYVREQTERLCEGLSAEDLSAQSMTDASPGKWHLAHTTWFFETFILIPHCPNYTPFNEDFNFLFNSYYESVGARHARHQRGLLTRPAFDEVIAYRYYVDDAMTSFDSESLEFLMTVGLHHEMQHQELLLTDLLHLMSHNSLNPAVITTSPRDGVSVATSSPLHMCDFDEGVYEVGAATCDEPGWAEFSYDCEQPIHNTYLHPFKLASRLVNNREWMEFIADGGYDDPLLWLSDGWSCCQREKWRAPLYWIHRQDQWWQFGLDGLQPLNPDAPVCHISYYEAEAFARWCGKRLPREHEWEVAAAKNKSAIEGNFLERRLWRPQASNSASGHFADMYGDVWEWTQSAFSPYPGFSPKQGALGEYNGKFMANQFVLKGGSCATPRWQMRSTYRNFFYPHQRWQFSGVRLAQD